MLENKKIETYSEDIAEVIGNAEEGFVKKIIHEQGEHEDENKDLSLEVKKNKIFIFVSILFIVFTLGILFFLITFKKEIFSVNLEKQFTSIIFIDKSEFKEIYNFNKNEILRSIFTEQNKIKNNEIKGIYFTENKKVIGFYRFSELIKVKENLDITFFKDNFLLGFFKKEGSSFFILLKVNSFNLVFPSMQNWENKMFNDLHEFFKITLSSETKYLLTKNFEDGFIQNKNARILYDKDGKIVIMYIIVDDNTIIIADTENTAQELILRFTSSTVGK
ncbi:MAG: hypothetical protein AAB693_02025 [Patescibacteria group bacterium]